jgi:type I restriction enzyme, S subunit
VIRRWPLVPLGELCEVNIGRTPSRSEAAYWGPGSPWVSISDLNQGRDILSARETITERAIQECNCRLVAPGTVLLSFKLSIGKVGIARVPLYTNEAIASLPIIDPCRLDTGFLYWALNAADLTAGLDRAAKGLTLNKPKLLAAGIPVPPLSEQRRIVDVLDRAEALRQKRRYALRELDSLIRAIFFDIFGDLADNKRRWEVKPLASLVRTGDAISYGVVQPGSDVEDGVPLVRVGDLVDGRVSHARIKRIAPSIERTYKRSRLLGDELLVSCVGSVGEIALASETEKGFNVARAVARVPLDSYVERVYVAEYLRTDAIQRYFANELRTVSQPTLNIKQLSETLVVLPPVDAQREFAHRVAAVHCVRDGHRASLREMDALFASLQHRAFRGEL